MPFTKPISRELQSLSGGQRRARRLGLPAGRGPAPAASGHSGSASAAPGPGSCPRRPPRTGQPEPRELRTPRSWLTSGAKQRGKREAGRNSRTSDRFSFLWSPRLAARFLACFLLPSCLHTSPHPRQAAPAARSSRPPCPASRSRRPHLGAGGEPLPLRSAARRGGCSGCAGSAADFCRRRGEASMGYGQLHEIQRGRVRLGPTTPISAPGLGKAAGKCSAEKALGVLKNSQLKESWCVPRTAHRGHRQPGLGRELCDQQDQGSDHPSGLGADEAAP